jgi:4-amino-4-deoxy-L-arabinose transferase-like glycosyltransferase
MIAAASRGWRPYAVLFLLCLGLYLPGMAALPVMDRDEARFAQATRQMLESGDYLDIRFQNEARNNKPAAIYWLQATAVAALGDAESPAIWPYRVPSLVGATGAVLLTFFFGARLVGGGAALLGAALLASSLGLVAEAHLAKTDAVLLLTCVAGQGAMAEIFSGRASRRWAFLFWIAEGAATLVKGPVGPGLALLTAASLSLAGRDARWLKGLKPLWGVPLFLAIVLPWLVAISLATHGAFVSQSMGHDFLAKIFGAQESHGAWPGTYLLLLPVNFWPGSLLLGAAAVYAWRERGDPGVKVLIAWAVPFWIVLELVPTKLPHYMLPIFPALALLAGRAALDARAGLPSWWRRSVAAIWALAMLAVAVVLAAAPLVLGERIEVAGAVGALAVLALGATLASRLWRAVTPGLAPGAALLALCAVPALAVEAPRLHPLWLSREAAAMVMKFSPPHGVPIDVVGYDEPSLVFLLGTATVIATPQQAAARLASSPALVEGREDAAFRAAAQAQGIAAQAVGHVAGLDYSNGRRMVLTLYRGAAR